MKNKFIKSIILLQLLLLLGSKQAFASSSYITIVNPIRNRSLWQNKDLTYLTKQIDLYKTYNLPVTWLIQYDTLHDKDVINTLKRLNSNNEIGLFLEVSENLATDAFVPYLIGNGDWARPDKVFFSGYEPSERKRLIDRLVITFESTFGYKPTSVGAWYIDAVTLNYLHDKYGITAAIQCADQYSTDTYETWGKYFGTPYYPSKLNSLIPAQTPRNLLNVVTTQWALRDPLRGFGDSVFDSTFSLQANDYRKFHNLTTNYFNNVMDEYIATKNPISQATVGLEVGSETEFLPELANQVDSIGKKQQQGMITVVTMTEFSTIFKQRSKINHSFLITSKDNTANKTAIWWMTPFLRIGLLVDGSTLFLQDLKIYTEEAIGIDQFVQDKRHVLYRSVPSVIDGVITKNSQALTTGVELFEINRQGDNAQVVINTSSGNHTISLNQDSIVFDSGTLFSWDSNRVRLNLGNKFYVGFLDPAFMTINNLLPRPIGYSTINDSFIVGIKQGYDGLLGASLKPLRLGLFNYPFQTLVEFKFIPSKSIFNHFYLSYPDFEAKQFLDHLDLDKYLLIPRGLSLQEIKQKELNGDRRIFENDKFQIWIHKK